MSWGGRRGQRQRTRRWVSVAIVVAIVLSGSVYLFVTAGRQGPTTDQMKPIILYVNQGNGVVNGSDFGAMLGFASSNGFNTVFFQVYREGALLFSPQALQSFVNQAHLAHLSIYFALYITHQTQELPSSIYDLNEDGISLDISTVPLASQQSFLSQLKASFTGKTAVTTTDLASTLRPDLLVLETYGADLRTYVKHGTISSVGAFFPATTSKQDYDDQYQYDLENSDGVMVFDYYNLLRSGY